MHLNWGNGLLVGLWIIIAVIIIIISRPLHTVATDGLAWQHRRRASERPKSQPAEYEDQTTFAEPFVEIAVLINLVDSSSISFFIFLSTCIIPRDHFPAAEILLWVDGSSVCLSVVYM